MKKRRKKTSCGLAAPPSSCPWSIQVFKHGDKRPYIGSTGKATKFAAGKGEKSTKRWYVLQNQDSGEHRQFMQKCLAERVHAGLCRGAK